MEVQVLKQTEVLGKPLSVYGTPDEPLFLAKDVAEWIDYAKTSQGYYNVSMMLKSVDEDEKLTINILYSDGKAHNQLFLTENGLYEVLMLSRKPIAKQFKQAVKAILHDIRKHGAYMTPQTIDELAANPDLLIKLATNLKEEQQKRMQAEETARLQQEELEKAAPKTQYYDNVLQSNNTYTTEQIAKECGITSAKALNKILHDMGIIFYQSGQWLLYAQYCGNGYTKSRTHLFTRSDGSQGTNTITVWTEQGRRFIHEKLAV